MSTSSYNALFLDGKPADLGDLPDIPISYKLEDRFDAQNKTSAEALSIQLPATLNNSQLSNDYSNPSVEDLTSGQAFKNSRQVTYESKGNTIFHGKALLKAGKHTHRPTSFTYDMYSDNANWVIPLKDATLYDQVKHIQIPFTQSTIQNSWAFDGTNEALPYVFAPVRYGRPMETYSVAITGGTKTVRDYNMRTGYMKPALSVYWIIYWGLKSQGFRLVSQFMDTPYFRRQVMPWTWGGFAKLNESRFDILRFLAESTQEVSYSDFNMLQFIDVKASNDFSGAGFDNAGDPGAYTYNASTGEMRWTYLNGYPYGNIEVHFQLNLNIEAKARGLPARVKISVYWYKNGVQIGSPATVVDVGPVTNFYPAAGNIYTLGLAVDVSPGDYVSAKVYVLAMVDSKSTNSLKISVSSFKPEYFQNAQNSVIDFANFTAFKNYKWLDFLAGVFDLVDMSIGTDPISKVVYMEPTHAYSLNNDFYVLRAGYFNGDWVDWSEKMDLSKESTLELFSDANREQIYSFRDDSSDGLLKKVQDRSSVKLAQGKYVLPDRFKTDKTPIENRFFSPTMHYDVKQWGDITGTAPQMVAMVPENISNTSEEEAENTFQPKICYYKGIVSGQSWVFEGATQAGFPMMFAVNYQPGGQNDPILSYSDEKIGNDSAGYAIGRGLLFRFYLQRLAIMRNGQYYSPAWLRPNNNDVSNVLHREHKIMAGQKWELVEITGYREDEAVECHLRKHTPVIAEDGAAVFPSTASVLLGTVGANAYDTKYNPLKCLTSDIKS